MKSQENIISAREKSLIILNWDGAEQKQKMQACAGEVLLKCRSQVLKTVEWNQNFVAHLGKNFSSVFNGRWLFPVLVQQAKLHPDPHQVQV